MSGISRMKLIKLLCFFWLSWSCAVAAISLGSPKLLSQPGEPLKVEFPIRFASAEQSALSSLNVGIANKETFDRLGISQKILALNPQAMIYRNKQEQLTVLLETVESVPVTDDPFLDVLVALNWSAGSLTKAYTLLLGDTQKIVVRQGQTLSEIAAQLAQRLDGASLDQTMLALFKANPDAFASGSINRLEAGVELNKPNQALLRSISPAEAQQFVAESNAQWLSEREARSVGQGSSVLKGISDTQPKDRLKIGSSTEGNAEERRYTEDLVAQEKVLEQTRARVAELEKNISDLQYLLDQAKGKSSESIKNDGLFGLGDFAPTLFALVLMGLTGLLLWLLAKNARRSEVRNFADTLPTSVTANKHHLSSSTPLPDRAKALFTGIDLDLTPVKNSIPTLVPEINPLADALRVKLNLARAYITIEDFSAAKKSLQEIISIGEVIDPATTAMAQELLLELSQHNR
jgi:pilus assembly protein FimV